MTMFGLVSSDWVGISITAILGVATLFFGNNYRRQLHLRLADKRLSAYADLWSATGLAAPTRLFRGPSGALTARERERIYREMTNWYYQNGNGMLLAKVTRQLYLAAKHNLLCDNDALRPAALNDLLSSFENAKTNNERRGCLSIRQLSLLRTQMKSDLAIYGLAYAGKLKDHELAFLRYCKVSLRRQPWRNSAPWGCMVLGRLGGRLPGTSSLPCEECKEGA